MPSRPKLADPGQLIRSAKRRTDTYRLCTNPDLVAEYEELLERFGEQRAADADADSLAGGGPANALQVELDALVARIGDETVELTFRALPRPRYRALVDAHPPKKDESGEVTDRRSKALGVDYDAFFAELIRTSLVTPELDDETLTTLIDDVLTASQWRDMSTVVWNLNESGVDVPFLPAVSPKTKASSQK
jgi:hypothetical protein